MTLPSDLQGLIELCAKAIAAGTSGEIDLYPIRRSFLRCRQEIPDALASSVEEHTRGRLTVRVASHALFMRQPLGDNLFLVVCDPSCPRGVIVKELHPSMRLLGFGPYSNGFDFPAEAR